jgi:murein DD-endopeptidase MepM/ murein hydrolase activator NlpD
VSEEIPIDQMPEWVRGMIDLRTNHAVWPVSEFRVGKFGAFGAIRTKPSEGLCGPKPGEPTPLSLEEEKRIEAARYPCKHYGADLQATEGTPVVVPHDGYLLYLGPADKPPFVGYGPGVALIANADIASNMWRRVWKWATGPLVDIFDLPEEARAGSYTLLGHIDVRPGPTVELPGDIWNSIADRPNTDHWRRLKQDPSHIVMMSDADAVNDPKRRVFAGQKLGWVSNKTGHVHWEMRKAPIAEKSQRFDPIETWRQVYGLALPQGSRVAQPASGGGGGAWLLLAALLMGKRKRKR